MNLEYEKGGGTACGMNAYADRSDASTLQALDRVMTEVAEWIESEAGVFLGHVKMAVIAGPRTVTLNLTSLEMGVDHHGSLPGGVPVEIKFMAAVLDVDHDELSERMKNALRSEGFRIKENRKVIELR